MKRVFLTVAAVLMAAAVASAQGYGTPSTKEAPAPSTKEAPAKPEGGKPEAAKEVEGKIKSVDRSGKTLTLEDGTKLMIPDTVKAEKRSLKKGAMVKATYEEKDGQKIVTSLEVREEEKPKT